MLRLITTIAMVFFSVALLAQYEVRHYKIKEKAVTFNNSQPILMYGDQHIFVDVNESLISVTGVSDDNKPYSRDYEIFNIKGDYKAGHKGYIMETFDQNKKRFNWHLYINHGYWYCVSVGEPVIIERYMVK